MVNVARIEEEVPMRFFADITIKCLDCGEPFHFVGVKAGLSPLEPMVSVDATELRAPIAPGAAPLARRNVFVMPPPGHSRS